MSNSTGTARNDLVQILSHANGTFDVLYNVPEHYENGWGNLVVAVLTGVCTHIANCDSVTTEDTCYYRDVSDLVRARKFMDAVVTHFPLHGISTDLSDSLGTHLSQNFSTRSIKSGVLDLGRFEDLDIENFAMSIQSILLSGSVLTNPVENSRGLVTVTAKFGEEVFKVRLTGFIPQAIAKVLRKPYEYVTNTTFEGFPRVERESAKSVRTPRGLVQKQIQTQIGGMVSEVAGMINALNDIQKRLSAINTTLQNAENQQQGQVLTGTPRESSSKTRQELHQDNMRPVQQEQNQQRRQFVKSQNTQSTQQHEQQQVQQKRAQIQQMTGREQRQELKKDLQDLGQQAINLYVSLSKNQKQGEGEQQKNDELRCNVTEQQQQYEAPAADLAWVNTVQQQVPVASSETPIKTGFTNIPVLSRKSKPVPRHSTGGEQVRHAFGDKLAAALKGRNDGPNEQELVEIDVLKDAQVVETLDIDMTHSIEIPVLVQNRA